jgi:peptidoglycan/xylan/chitin deacetylase (PgdA/CDA1 family)
VLYEVEGDGSETALGLMHPSQLRLRRGIEVCLWNLTAALVQTGVDVDVLTWRGVRDVPMKNASIVCPILTYHQITPLKNRGPGNHPGLYVHPRQFCLQMLYLRLTGHSVISLETLIKALLGEINLPYRPAVITFDDGYDGVYRYAYPILARLNWSATVFAIIQAIQQAEKEDAERRAEHLCYMSIGQLQVLSRSGWAIGSHSVTHPRLTELSEAGIQRELVESRELLQGWIQAPVDFFCYPQGVVNKQLQELVAASGYLGACGITFGSRHSKQHRYNLPRVAINWDHTLPLFAYRLWRGKRV